MRTFSGKRSALALAIAGVTAMSGLVVHLRRKLRVSSTILPSRAASITGSVNVTVKTSPKTNIKPTFLTPPGTPTWTSSQAMPQKCSAWISLHSPRSKWRKTATAATLTKLPSPPATKLTMKTGPVIRAVSACTRPQRNLNTARSGRVEGIFSQPARRC